MVKKFLHKITEILKSTKGYTLVEVAAVVAVTGTLAAVAIPVAKDKVEQGKIGAAKQDVQTIANAIMQLRGDTGVAPVFSLSTQRKFQTADITLLASLKGTTPIEAISGTGVGWATNGSEGILPTSSVTPPTAPNFPDNIANFTNGEDALENHLVRNGSEGNSIYDEKNWNGPYIPEGKADPWGHKYLCNIGDLYKWNITTDMPVNAVVVLSAGPDGIVQTPSNQTITSFGVSGDDIAFRIQ